MRKFLSFFSFVLLSFGFHQQLNAQTTTTKEYGYYIELSGINNKTNISSLEEIIKAKPSTIFFRGFTGVKVFHILKTSKAISKEEFTQWVSTLGVQVVLFEPKEITTAFIQSKKRLKPGVSENTYSDKKN